MTAALFSLGLCQCYLNYIPSKISKGPVIKFCVNLEITIAHGVQVFVINECYMHCQTVLEMSLFNVHLVPEVVLFGVQ